MKAELAQIIGSHLRDLGLPVPENLEIEPPKVKTQGDFSTNAAMVLAKPSKISPRELAGKLAESLKSETELFEKIEVAGPGFINFFLRPGAYHRAIQSLWKDDNTLILPEVGKGKKFLIEFVSANPTGPMHVGHGRNAVVGDCLARLLEAVGFEVVREFYINDHGVQIRTLGDSGCHYHTVLTRLGEVQAALPDDMYRGAYLEDLVNKLRDPITPLRSDPLAVGKLLGREILKGIQEELLRLGVVFDHYYSESSLYEDGKIDEALALLKSNHQTYEKDGALWFRTTDYGDDKDRVLIKSDNTYTYFTPDIAYHQVKFKRKMDGYINVMGADHGGYVPRLKAAVTAMGYDPDKLEFLLMQLVHLKRGDEIVSMSKRSGDFVTLGEVLEEVGRDATRFFFMMRSHNATLEFDLDLAKRQSAENPVYYIQYAHARMCSIFAKAQEGGYDPPEKITKVDLAPLDLPEEMELIKSLATFSDLLASAAEQREPHRIAFYLLDLARIFQNYYTRAKTDSRYKVISAKRDTTLAKLFLLKTLREVFRAGLKILGVGAPERMVKDED